MKKFSPWLFVLICFTAPDGSPVWLAKEQVVAVGRAVVGASPHSHSQIWLSSSNTFYVKESPDQVVEKLK